MNKYDCLSMTVKYVCSDCKLPNYCLPKYPEEDILGCLETRLEEDPLSSSQAKAVQLLLKLYDLKSIDRKLVKQIKNICSEE